MTDPTANPNEVGFVNKLVSAVPSWALGMIGTLLTLALVLKIIGIDFSGPVNELTTAYVEVIKMDAQEVKRGEEFRLQVLAMMTEQREIITAGVNDLTRSVTSNSTAIDALAESVANLNRSNAVLDARVTALEATSHKSTE